MHRPKHIAEYLLIRCVSATVNVLPARIALGLGSLFAATVFPFLKSTRKEGERRIRQVMGDELSDSEVSRIAREAFRELVWHTIEVLRTPKLTRPWVEKNCVFSAEDKGRLDEALAMNRGVIIAVAHVGNWDLAGIGLQQLGYPVNFIFREQKNPLFDKHLSKMREHLGSEAFERDDPMLVRKVIRSLRAGNVIAILVDLRARQPDLKLPFLGHPADLGRGLGLMAHLAKCPVAPGLVSRTADGKHLWRIAPVIHPDPSLDRNEDAERIMREALVPLEEVIRENPSQYFWFNKRWVLEPIPEKRG